MDNVLTRLLSTDGFMPHGMCYLWQPGVLGLHIASDALIAAAYFSIPFVLLQVVRRRPDLTFNWALICFAVFIVACGSTHLMDIWVIWHPVYWLSGGVKAITAAASVATAILLFKLVPATLRIPSAAAVEAAQARLQTEIAERMLAQESLRLANQLLDAERSRERLAAVIDSSEDAIISKTADGIITTWNRGAEAMFGYAAAEIIGQPATLLFPEELVAEEADILARIKRGERVQHFETTRVRKGGTRFDVSVTISPIRDEAGAIVGSSKIARDITERKKIDQALVEQAEALDLAQVMVRDIQGRILLWNRGAEGLYGFSREEAVGRISHDLMATQFPEPLADIEATLERLGSWSGELTHTRKDGTRIVIASVWVLHRGVRGGAGRVVESSTDITERKQTERKLTMQVARLDLLNHVTRAIGDRQDLASIYGVVLRALEEQLPLDYGCICHYQATENRLAVVSIGPTSHQLARRLGLTDQSTIAVDANGLSRCLQGELVYEPDTSALPFEFPASLSSGGLNALVAAPLQVEGQVFGLLIAARRQAHSFSSAECEFLKQLSEHVALAAHNAQLYGALQTAYDELRLTQQAVSQQERLRVMGQMASGIAHDINNALTPASLYSQMLLDEKGGLTGEARQHLIVVQRAIDDVAQSVARMKEFYRPRDLQNVHRPVDLNRAIEQVIELTRARWKTMPQEHGFVIQMEANLSLGLSVVMGSEAEIRDALTNILLNAVDAMPQGGTIAFRSRMSGPDQISVEVSDTGIGMDEATRTRCLEPFFTTKGERGSGLGLAMVYGMMERHGGTIQIDSEVGRGTQVTLVFPINLTTDALGNSNDTGLLQLCRPLRLLLIDDDAILLKSLGDALRRDGHTTVAAEGGQEGIEIFRAAQEHGAAFDLVITDLGMPKLDGRGVAIAIKSLAPKVPIILLTGWGHRLMAEQGTPRCVDRVLSKPPKLELLRATLAELARIAQ